MRKIAGLIAVVLVIVSSAQVWAEGLDSLIAVGKSMDDVNAAMAEETRAFNALKSAIDRGTIKKGLPKSSIMEQYGEPVIINDDSATKREKWAYKPATSSFLKGVRIYLYFDKNGMLDEARVVE